MQAEMQAEKSTKLKFMRNYFKIMELHTNQTRHYRILFVIDPKSPHQYQKILTL